MKNRYDKKVKGEIPKIGTLVWLDKPERKKREPKKLMKVWKGPYKVTNTTDNTIEIVNIRNGGNKRHVNMDRVKPAWIQEGKIVPNDIKILEEEKYNPLLIDTELEKENKKEWEINEDPVLKEERMKTRRKRIVNKIEKDI